jgi:hypothetical protein
MKEILASIDQHWNNQIYDAGRTYDIRKLFLHLKQ